MLSGSFGQTSFTTKSVWARRKREKASKEGRRERKKNVKTSVPVREVLGHECVVSLRQEGKNVARQEKE